MNDIKHIMIVDDDGDDKEFFLLALQDVDPKITSISAKDGFEAIELLNKAGTQLPDYIFLDLNMPRMNGIQCLIKLKESQKLRHIPVAVYSTTRREEDVDQIRQLGAVHFFTKPTQIEKISKCIANAFSYSLNS